MSSSPLDWFYQATTPQILQASVPLGVCFHIAIARASFEPERHLIRFLTFASILCIGHVVFFISLSGAGVGNVLAQSFALWAGFAAGLLASLTTYRLFLHRCRRFSGPLLAKVTRFYAMRLNMSDMQYYQEQRKLHGRYGDYLRMGPRDLSILDPAAIPLIYGPTSKCRKGTWYSAIGHDSDRVGIGGIREPAKYRPRRRNWDKGLSSKAMSTYLPRVKTLTDSLINSLRDRAGRSLDISAWSMFYTFDVMGEVGFGQSFGNVATGQEHTAIHAMHKQIQLAGPALAIPWLPLIVSAIPGLDVGVPEFFDICAKILEEKQQKFDGDKEPSDVVGWFLKAIDMKDASASPTKESLADDVRNVVMAGSDTTANVLANALFYLVKYSGVQRKLRQHLQAVIPNGYRSWQYAEVKTVTYIDDIVNETLRLKPPIIQGLPRETPAQGIRIGDSFVPGFVNVSVPVTLIQRDARWWKQPNDFIPERWTERREEMGTDNAPWFPFQLGMHACAGKGLAYLTLRTALSAIVLNFDISFAPGETGSKFDGNYLNSLMMTLRPLQLVFTPRSDA